MQEDAGSRGAWSPGGRLTGACLGSSYDSALKGSPLTGFKDSHPSQAKCAYTHSSLHFRSLIPWHSSLKNPVGFWCIKWHIDSLKFHLYKLLVSGERGFLGGSDGKESACNAGDVGLILGSGSSPGEGDGYPLQYSCLENSTDTGAWQAIVHGVAKLDMTEWLTLSLSIRNWVTITSWVNFPKQCTRFCGEIQTKCVRLILQRWIYLTRSILIELNPHRAVLVFQNPRKWWTDALVESKQNLLNIT